MPRRRFPLLAVLLAGLLLVAGCAGPAATSSPGPSGPALTTAALRLALIDRFGAPWFCDPDAYPVGRDEQQQALDRWPEVQRDTEALEVILARMHLAAGAFTDGQKLEIYRAWKQLNAVVIDPVGNGRYRFDLRSMPPAGATEGTRTAGLVDAEGTITVEQQAPAQAPNCPICLDASAPIGTPGGAVRVDAVAVGDPVWTLDSTGARVRGVVLAVRSVAAPARHELVHLVLDDGRELLASPGHPLADGRPLGTLAVGDLVDGARVTGVTRVVSGPRTWDLLPSGATATYFVDGIPLGSTLAP